MPLFDKNFMLHDFRYQLNTRASFPCELAIPILSQASKKLFYLRYRRKNVISGMRTKTINVIIFN